MNRDFSKTKRSRTNKPIDPKRFARKGRLLSFDGQNWRWICSHRKVVAFSDKGDRLEEDTWRVLGLNDGIDYYEQQAVWPSDVRFWIENVMQSKN